MDFENLALGASVSQMMFGHIRVNWIQRMFCICSYHIISAKFGGLIWLKLNAEYRV